MKSNYIHVCFVIDRSGSMYDSTQDVEGGIQKVIEEQKAVKDGTCSVSLFEFDTKINQRFLFKDVNEFPEYKFTTGGLTAMNDGIGTAIDVIGKKLSEMPEEERPEQNLFVIITDGYENASKEYTFEQVKEKIKHQEEKYSWKFIYFGVDITDRSQANKLGLGTQGYMSRKDLSNSYSIVGSAATCYRTASGDSTAKFAVMDSWIESSINDCISSDNA